MVATHTEKTWKWYLIMLENLNFLEFNVIIENSWKIYWNTLKCTELSDIVQIQYEKMEFC